MAGYRPSAMVRTPWGDASRLRERMLRPGRGMPRAEAERNQRERLFAALVATLAEKGYEATRVEDLVSLSGVSRSAFYRHFSDKKDCLLAAVEALVEPSLQAIGAVEHGLIRGGAPTRTRGAPDPPSSTAPSGGEEALQAFKAFVDLVVSQPAASRMCFVEIYAAGPEAVAVVDRTLDAFTAFGRRMLTRMPGREETPPELVRAVIGGLQKVVHKRLYSGEHEELPSLTPQMWQWALSYSPPPEPLRVPRRRAVKARPLEERQAVANPAERILRALAAAVSAKGYPEATVAEIVECAQTSQRTFYEHFANKEEAMLAALDSGSAQMLAATLPAFRRAPDWPRAVRGAYEAMFAFGVEEPEYARLGTVEMYAAGKRALEQRDKVMEGMEALLAPGYELAPTTPAVAGEAIGGAIYALLYDQVKAKGPESLPELVPLATYLTLAPFLGAEEAYEVACE